MAHHAPPADMTSEDHDWRSCGCDDCYDMRRDIYWDGLNG